ncbi:unnamed protein product [Thlaspi arvense]|uniref:Uncharacterized protein n=1 Tax=Thlaspi arvense TaxID=13288 RepID=A0AAU9RSJ1_THLAR|nr:unnamed protein product [Thlaspi arvense]
MYWNRWLESVYLLCDPEDSEYQRPRYDPEKAKYTIEEEIDRIRKEITESDGFDIDFSYYRCVFNYHSAYLDSCEIAEEPETDGDLLKKLAQNSLDDYNKLNKTEFKFVKVEKANFHVSGAALMFLITFEVVDPYDDVTKPFQARLRHILLDSSTEYVFCRPKPNQTGGMRDECEVLSGWRSWVEHAYVVKPAGDPECLKHHYIPKPEDNIPHLTQDEEIKEINRQIRESEGFDIDFSKFRCLFNYHLVDPDDHDFLDEPGTNEVLMRILTKESVKQYNKEKGTRIQFLEVEKANYYFCNGYMFLITFKVFDHTDKEKKTYQARIHYSTHYPTEYVFVRPKPDPEDSSDEESSDSEEDVSEEGNSEEGSDEGVKNEEDIDPSSFQMGRIEK